MRLLAIATVGVVAGCGSSRCEPGGFIPRCAPPAGQVTITAPAAYGPPTSLRIDGLSCLGVDGTCSVSPYVLMFASFEGFDEQTPLMIHMTVPAGEGPATYTIATPGGPGPPVIQGFFDPSLIGYEADPLAALSASVTVEHSTTDAFSAAFEMELETSQHEHFSLTQGHFQVDGCALEYLPPTCSAPN